MAVRGSKEAIAEYLKSLTPEQREALIEKHKQMEKRLAGVPVYDPISSEPSEK